MASLPKVFNRGAISKTPMRELLNLQRRVDRMFDDFWGPGAFELEVSPLQAPVLTPTCDVEETDNHYLMSFDLPGVKKEDIKIDLHDGLLTVSGERKEEHEEKSAKSYQSERFYGSFQRSFQLPVGTKPEQIEAQYSDGVLRVAVPKTEMSKAQQIKIAEGKTGFLEKFRGQKKAA